MPESMIHSKASNTLLTLSMIASLSVSSGCDFSMGDDSKDESKANPAGTSTTGGTQSAGSSAAPGSSGAAEDSAGGTAPDSTSSAPEQGDEAADNLPAGAIDLGVLGPEIKSFGSHALSEKDRVDYFRFEVSGAGKTVLRLKKNPESYVHLAVTSADPNADQSSKIIHTRQRQENSDHIFALPKGQYLLQLKYNGSDYVPYELSMLVTPGLAPEPEPEPGNHFDEALVVEGIESANISLGGYVGVADRSDFYRISTPADRTVKLSPSGTFGSYRVEVYKEDGVSGKSVKSWYINERSSVEPTFKTKEGGVYFIEISSGREYGSLYKLVGGLL